MNLFKSIQVLFSPDKDLYRSIKNIFGFYPRNIFPYKLALRHKSVAKELANGMRLSNERLEYLGDAVLSAVTADFLFKKFPFKDEGFLTEMRSKLVSRDQLNKLSGKLGLEELILTETDGNGTPKSIKGDAFEAMIGAMYLDKGYMFSKRILINRIINTHFDIEELVNTEVNFKSKLIEWAQKNKKFVEFKVIDEIGTGHGRQYEVEVFVDDVGEAIARDYSIKGAEKRSAEKACLKLEIQSENS